MVEASTWKASKIASATPACNLFLVLKVWAAVWKRLRFCICEHCFKSFMKLVGKFTLVTARHGNLLDDSRTSLSSHLVRAVKREKRLKMMWIKIVKEGICKNNWSYSNVAVKVSFHLLKISFILKRFLLSSYVRMCSTFSTTKNKFHAFASAKFTWRNSKRNSSCIGFLQDFGLSLPGKLSLSKFGFRISLQLGLRDVSIWTFSDCEQNFPLLPPWRQSRTSHLFSRQLFLNNLEFRVEKYLEIQFFVLIESNFRFISRLCEEKLILCLYFDGFLSPWRDFIINIPFLSCRDILRQRYLLRGRLRRKEIKLENREKNFKRNLRLAYAIP